MNQIIYTSVSWKKEIQMTTRLLTINHYFRDGGFDIHSIQAVAPIIHTLPSFTIFY